MQWMLISSCNMAFKCSKCNMEFDDKERLERHRQVHGRKPKVRYAGSMNFDQVGV